MIEPITPQEVVTGKKRITPDFVIDAFNRMISKHWNGHVANVPHTEVVQLICELGGVSSDTVYQQKWLDIEDVFRAAGWKVKYDRPGFNESYPAFWQFSK